MNNSPYSGKPLHRNSRTFLIGKTFSALLTFSILLWLVRLLPVDEYGAYVTMIAGTELGFAIAGIGLPWLAARYVPEFRLHASGTALRRFCHQLLFWQALALLVFNLLLFAFVDVYLDWVDLARFRMSALIYLGVLLFDGMGGFLREALLEPLMLQVQARSSMIARQLCFVSLIAVLDFNNLGALYQVAWSELAASILGMILALIGLWRHLNMLRAQVEQPNWSEPDISKQWHIAIRMYLAYLFTLTYSSQVLINIILHVEGGTAAALFGFLRNLRDQIGRYLPATLLFSLIRPKLIASYVSSGGITELNRNANLVGKLSLFVLMPLLAISALEGDRIIALLSGGRFADSGWFLLGFVLVLVPSSQRQLLESVAVATGHASLCTKAAVYGVAMLPLMWVLLDLGLGLWSAIIVTFLGQWLFNILVITGISKRTGYLIDNLGLLKLLLSALSAYAASIWLSMMIPAFWGGQWPPLILQFIFTLLLYLFFAWCLKPFTTDERDRINALVKRRVFVW